MKLESSQSSCSRSAELLLALAAYRDPSSVVSISHRLANDPQQSTIAYARELSSYEPEEIKTRAIKILHQFGFKLGQNSSEDKRTAEMNRLNKITRYFTTQLEKRTTKEGRSEQW